MGVALLILGGLAAFVGGLMIVVAAFRVSILWGLGCLLVPFASIVFVVLHWDETRPWLFLNLGGLLVAVMGTLFLPSGEMIDLARPAGWEEPTPIAGPRTREIFRGAPPARAGDDPPARGPLRGSPDAEDAGAPRAEAAAPAPPSTGRLNPSLQPRVSLQTREETISVERAGQYLNRLVEITKIDGERFKARIREVRGDVLVVERPVGGGAVTFSLPKAHVQQIRVTTTNR